MTKSKRRKYTSFVALFVAITIILTTILSAVSVFAADGQSYTTLKMNCKSAETPPEYAQDKKEIQEKRYKRSGGDYYMYTEITGGGTTSDIIVEDIYNDLTPKAKQEFLKDFISVAYMWEDACSRGTAALGQGIMITGETVTDLLNELQQVSGAGSQIMAALMADTKPDYATANRIYQPFSGIVGTALGLISILIMALLGVTMALDIAYIVIPAFQLMLDGDSDSGQGGGKGMSKIISQEAKSAVQAVNNGGGGQTGSGNKMALGQYFKMRWKALIVLGICLLYLVQGQIYTFVAWIIDLVSGFLGF